jgi:transposase
MAKSKKIEFTRDHLHFSKEQKIRIVQEVESGQMTRKEAMEKYNIVGHNTLNSWLRQFGNNPEGIIRSQHRKADQRLAAYKIITGETTVGEVARSMQIAPETVSGWVRKYEKDVQQKTPPVKKLVNGEHEKESGKAKQKEIEELKLKVAGLEMMIDIAEKELKIDIRKKPGTKQ